MDPTAAALLQQFKTNRASGLSLEVVEDLAAQFQTDLDKDTEIRDELRKVSRKLERQVKNVVHILQRIHLEAETDDKCRLIGEKGIEGVTADIAPILALCDEKLPKKEYFKYSDMFRFNVIKSVFAIGLSKFLIDGSFATIDYVAELLKIPTADKRENNSGLFLEWEEYLEGMIDVGQELARLAKNCVILDNFGLVGRIHSYMSTLTYGFSGMNFRNDGLRRRYDSLKVRLSCN